MRFFIGLHQPCDAVHFKAAFISVNRLKTRKSPFRVKDWIMDSGAFTELSRYGYYRTSVQKYAHEVNRWASCGNLLAAVSQDYMCEPWIVQRTGLSVLKHQELTIKRFDTLVALSDVPVLPVLQGYAPEDYVQHVRMYAERLWDGQWVGVGSICKRNGNPEAILTVLSGIKQERPDLRLHGFGLKKTSLAQPKIRALLHTADSMAWSFSARRQGRDANSWKTAKQFEREINKLAA